jgi:hypothetical protein
MRIERVAHRVRKLSSPNSTLLKGFRLWGTCSVKKIGKNVALKTQAAILPALSSGEHGEGKTKTQ